MTVTSTIRKVRLDNVFANPDQPRKTFSAEAIAELAASIEENGMIQPITVVKRPEGRFMIVTGERRYRAHLLLGVDHIEVAIKDMSDDQIRIAAIIENLQRVDVSPLEQARAYQASLESGIANDEDGKPCIKVLAKKLGVKQPHRIAHSIALLNLTLECQVVMENGQLSGNQAWYLAKLAPEKQALLLQSIRSGVCDTDTKLKACYDRFCREGQDAHVNSTLDLGVFDTVTQRKANNLQHKLEALAAAMADLDCHEDWDAIDGKIPASQAAVMALVARNVARTACNIQKSMERQSV